MLYISSVTDWWFWLYKWFYDKGWLKSKKKIELHQVLKAQICSQTMGIFFDHTISWLHLKSPTSNLTFPKIKSNPAFLSFSLIKIFFSKKRIYLVGSFLVMACGPVDWRANRAEWATKSPPLVELITVNFEIKCIDTQDVCLKVI